MIAIGGVAASGTPYEACYIGGIFGASVNTGTALPVYVDTDGHLGTVLVNATGTRSAAPLHRGKSLQPQARFNQKVEKLEARVAQQQKQIETLTAQLREQVTQIQKVSAQIEVSKAAPRTVVNNQ